MSLIILVAMFGLMWVLFILPQQRRVRQHRELVQAIGVGDEVVTAGGLFGTITAMDDESVTLQVAPGVEVRLLRGAISRRVDFSGQVEPLEESAERAELLQEIDDANAAAEPTEGDQRPEREDG